MANGLEWQDVLQEAADELCAVNGDDELAALVVAAHAQVHVVLVDAHDALVGDGHAVGVAAQVVQHHLAHLCHHFAGFGFWTDVTPCQH